MTKYRKRCLKKGHKWNSPMFLPVEFCSRFFCDASRISNTYPMMPEMRKVLKDELRKREENA